MKLSEIRWFGAMVNTFDRDKIEFQLSLSTNRIVEQLGSWIDARQITLSPPVFKALSMYPESKQSPNALLFSVREMSRWSYDTLLNIARQQQHFRTLLHSTSRWRDIDGSKKKFGNDAASCF